MMFPTYCDGGLVNCHLVVLWLLSVHFCFSTDRGNDNWLIKYDYPLDSTSVRVSENQSHAALKVPIVTLIINAFHMKRHYRMGRGWHAVFIKGHI